MKDEKIDRLRSQFVDRKHVAFHDHGCSICSAFETKRSDALALLDRAKVANRLEESNRFAWDLIGQLLEGEIEIDDVFHAVIRVGSKSGKNGEANP